MRSAKALLVSCFALLALLPSLTRPSPVEVDGDDNDVFIDHPMDPDLFEGDIILPKHYRSTKLKDENNKWDKGIVPYEIDESLQNEDMIAEAIQEFNDAGTCVQFVKRTNQQDYIKFVKQSEPGCSSKVGKMGGEQIIKVHPSTCPKETVLHQLMHVLGFYHEETRPDRDMYLKYNEQNVETGLEGNFKKKAKSDTLGLGYDFCSIMHHHSTYLSKDKKNLPTLELKDRTIFIDNLPTLELKDWDIFRDVRGLCGHDFGRAKSLSKLDINKVNRLYQCKIKPTPLTDPGLYPGVKSKKAKECYEENRKSTEFWNTTVLEWDGSGYFFGCLIQTEFSNGSIEQVLAWCDEAVKSRDCVGGRAEYAIIKCGFCYIEKVYTRPTGPGWWTDIL